MDRQAIGLLVLFGIIGIGRAAWLHAEARGIAESWLMRNHYKVHRLTVGLFTFMRFAPRFFRNADSAHTFRAEVTDLSLGGTGIMWLRVWTDRIGLATREPDISWEVMPRADVATPQAQLPLGEQWRVAQHALLERIAAGESSFVAPRGEAAAAAFDEQVEHLLAMQRRGLITCDPPLQARTAGALYDAISNVALTDTGRSYLKITS